MLQVAVGALLLFAGMVALVLLSSYRVSQPSLLVIS